MGHQLSGTESEKVVCSRDIYRPVVVKSPLTTNRDAESLTLEV